MRCLEDLSGWLERLHLHAKPAEAPARIVQVQKRLSEAVLSVTQRPDEQNQWQNLLSTLAEAEGFLREGSGLSVGPVPSLRLEWVTAADDGSAEFRLAVACALQTWELQGKQPVDGVRRHWLPLDKGRFAASSSSGERIRRGPEVVIMGKRGLDDAIALVRRRLVEAGQERAHRLPLVSASGAAAYPSDLARLLADQVDLDRTMKLACALMAVDGSKWAARPMPPAPPAGDDGALPEEAWMVIRLAMAPWPLPNKGEVGVDPVIFRRLESGDAASAVRIAARRLRHVGIAAAPRFAFVSPQTARLWAAALAFPIDRKTAKRFLLRIDPHILKEEAA